MSAVGFSSHLPQIEASPFGAIAPHPPGQRRRLGLQMTGAVTLPIVLLTYRACPSALLTHLWRVRMLRTASELSVSWLT
ncbi:unnamed protein product [Heligmosomoides polygyrus]|uniref:Uncharacterized protein n=1 Tax=Heligmosomoides polygyrus TaxID=6339 RepID=A0A183FEB8_HELPZ|nr:unnamed protein product [Heligmosomoides polygyrus]